MSERRISPKRKAKELAKYLRGERPDYAYLKSLFQHLRAELEVEVPITAKKLPYVPTEEELKRYYGVVWQTKNFQDMMIVKTLLYTGVRVSELINIKLSDVDFHYCQIRINKGKGSKDRIVPFPPIVQRNAGHARRFNEKEASGLSVRIIMEEKIYPSGNTKDLGQIFGGSRPCTKSIAA
ncbi:tyrosine-type recombinase/integrase [Paenibacillus sp. TAB 01]|uniref:tyrosine-type recombinase/integrase n=1 Tax=Paenibacillus sp. TAB 01 TaxID=3368988 RepID=UPI0037521765